MKKISLFIVVLGILPACQPGPAPSLHENGSDNGHGVQVTYKDVTYYSMYRLLAAKDILQLALDSPQKNSPKDECPATEVVRSQPDYKVFQLDSKSCTQYDDKLRKRVNISDIEGKEDFEMFLTKGSRLRRLEYETMGYKLKLTNEEKNTDVPEGEAYLREDNNLVATLKDVMFRKDTQQVKRLVYSVDYEVKMGRSYQKIEREETTAYENAKQMVRVSGDFVVAPDTKSVQKVEDYSVQFEWNLDRNIAGGDTIHDTLAADFDGEGKELMFKLNCELPAGRIDIDYVHTDNWEDKPDKNKNVRVAKLVQNKNSLSCRQAGFAEKDNWIPYGAIYLK